MLVALLFTLGSLQAASPLRVHPDNPRYFTDHSGKAILLAGSHTWPNFVDMGPSDPSSGFDFDAYLAWLKRYGHNFTRGRTWEPTRWDTTGMKAREWRNGNLTLLTLLPLAPLDVLHAAEQRSANRADNTPSGKTYIYKQSAGQPRDMEIYFPPNHDPAKAKLPGLILFHGGGWSGGNLSQFRKACHYFASRGLVAATVNYQMLSKADAAKLPKGETRKRVCITDAKSAIRWFKQHATDLGIDPARIITGGGSAGGHISALATLNPGLNDPVDPKDIDTSVVAYLWFNPAFSPDDSQDAEVDVLRHLKKDIAPAIACFGTKDTWLKGWDAAQAKLKSLGNTATELWLAEGQTHSFFNQDPWQTVTLIAADRFLVQHGFLRGEPTLTSPATGEKLVRRP